MFLDDHGLAILNMHTSRRLAIFVAVYVCGASRALANVIGHACNDDFGTSSLGVTLRAPFMKQTLDLASEWDDNFARMAMLHGVRPVKEPQSQWVVTTPGDVTCDPRNSGQSRFAMDLRFFSSIVCCDTTEN